MPWWSWWLIWGVLVLALIGMLAFFAVVLFRKTVAAADELGALSEALAVLERRLDDIAPQRTPSAVFQNRDELALIVHLNSQKRARRRQHRHDARMARAKLLVRSENWTPPHAQ